MKWLFFSLLLFLQAQRVKGFGGGCTACTVGDCWYTNAANTATACFYYNSGGVSDNTAAQRCWDGTHGAIGMLASLYSTDLQTAGREYVQSKGGNSLWLGAHQENNLDEPAGNWVWYNPCGETYPFSAAFWRPNEPNNHGGSEDSVQFIVSDQSANDLRSTSNLPYLCRFDEAPGACCAKPTSAGANAFVASFSGDAAAYVNTVTHATTGATAIIRCNPGFALAGTAGQTEKTITCGADRQWDVDPTTVTSYKLVNSWRYGNELQITCTTAYTCNGITTTQLVKGLNGICYAPFTDKCNWDTCFQRCRTNTIAGDGGSHTNGQLAIMDSDAIADFMFTEVQTPMGWASGKHIFIGGKQYDNVIEPDGHYVWYGPRSGETWEFPRLSTGGTAGLLPWTVNQPNNGAQSPDGKQDCAAALSRGFHDIACGASYTYICQYGPPELCSATSCPNGGECRHLDPHYKSFGCFHFENTPTTAEQAAKNCRDGTHGFQGELAVMNSNEVKSIMRDFVGPSTTCFHAGGKQSDQNNEGTGGNWVWENPCGMNTPFSAYDFWGNSQPANLLATPYEMTVMQCQDGLHTASNTDTAVYVCRIDTAPGFCCTKPINLAPNTNVMSYTNDADTDGRLNTDTHAAAGAKMNIACDPGFVLNYDWDKNSDTVQCATEQTWEQDPNVFKCMKVYTCNGVKTVQPAAELNGACYVAYPNASDFDTSKGLCENTVLNGIDNIGKHEKGQLAIVNTAALLNTIAGNLLIESATYSSTQVFIGAKQYDKTQEPGGHFQWHGSQTNELWELPPNFAAQTSISYATSDTGGTEDCLSVRATTAVDGKLNDITCSTTAPFICQYGPTPNCNASSCPDGGDCKHLDPHYKSFGCFKYVATSLTAEKAQRKCRDGSLGFVGELVLLDSWDVKSIVRGLVDTNVDCIHTGGTLDEHGWNWLNPCGMKTPFSPEDIWDTSEPAHSYVTTKTTTAMQCKNGMKSTDGTIAAPFICRIDTAPAPCCLKPPDDMESYNATIVSFMDKLDARMNESTHGPVETKMNVKCFDDHYLGPEEETIETEMTFTCQSEQTWAPDLSEMNCKPYKCKVDGDQAGRAIGMGSFTISSIYLIVALASLLIVFLIVRDFSICRFYHIIQEGSLLITQLIILPARSGTLLDLNAFCFSSDFVAPQLSSGWCKVIAVTLHYLFLVFFLALFFEALHNYTVFTNVTAYEPLLTRWQVPLVCLILPIPFVAPCAIFFLDGYIHDNTCWLNFSSAENVYIELVPMCLLFAVTIIISEATGMVEYPKHLAANEPARFSALANSKAGMIFPCVSLGLWLTGMLAVHYTDAALYSIASIFNIGLASTMLFFHTAGSARARYLLKRAFCSCCKSCGMIIEKPA